MKEQPSQKAQTELMEAQHGQEAQSRHMGERSMQVVLVKVSRQRRMRRGSASWESIWDFADRIWLVGTWFGRLVGADFADFFSVYRAPASARYFLNCSASDFYFVADTFMERAFQQKRI